MNRRSFVLMTMVLVIFTGPLTAQVTSGSEEDLVESVLERSSSEDDAGNDADLLESIRNEPIDVHRPVYSDLIRLPMISPMIAESMILLSDTVEITDVEQYRMASVMTDQLFERIKPFIAIRNGTGNSSGHSLFPSALDMRTRTAYRSVIPGELGKEQFLGGPASVYHRMRILNTRYEGVFVMEKDPGELTENGFFSGALTFKEVGPLQRFIFGDYHIATDQGLIFARANSGAKGTDAAGQIRKRGRNLTANISADEVNAFRGAAVESSSGPVSFLLFVSKKELSATIDTAGEITSFYVTGLYRDPLELRKKNTVRSSTSGGRIGWTLGGRSSLSLTMMNNYYDRDFSADQIASGKRSSQTAGSIGVEISKHEFSFFGETATDDLRRFSFSGGINVPFTRWFSVSYHHRTFAQGYSTPFAHPFGEQSNIVKGESGDYIGISLNDGAYHADVYFDRALFPSFQRSFSSQSAESFFALEFPLSKEFSTYGHIKIKKRIGLFVEEDNDERSQTNYRLEFRFKVSGRFTLTNRYEVSDVNVLPEKKHESGMLMFIDAAYHHPGIGFRFRSRWIFFDAPSYDSRLYQFESGVRGSFSNPPLYGKGIRWYCVLGYELLTDVLLSFKYSTVKKLSDLGRPFTGDDSAVLRDDFMTFQLDFQL
jgi:hypothetical protein